MKVYSGEFKVKVRASKYLTTKGVNEKYYFIREISKDIDESTKFANKILKTVMAKKKCKKKRKK